MNLGFGVGLREHHYEEILTAPHSIDWFEIISDNFLEMQGLSYNFLEMLLERYPVAMHGVSVNIGGRDPLDFTYLKQVKALAKKTKTPWVSDHLCFSKLGENHFHTFLPLPFTSTMAEHVVERAKIVQDFLELPFALENLSSYASYNQDEMPEWEFCSMIAEKANTYILLDVNNIYVASKNLGFSTEDYYKNISHERILQIHLAGHQNLGNYIIDTHDTRVCDDVWDLYGKIISITGEVSTLLEWEDSFLPFDETCKEVLKAKKIQNKFVANAVG